MEGSSKRRARRTDKQQSDLGIKERRKTKLEDEKTQTNDGADAGEEEKHQISADSKAADSAEKIRGGFAEKIRAGSAENIGTEKLGSKEGISEEKTPFISDQAGSKKTTKPEIEKKGSAEAMKVGPAETVKPGSAEAIKPGSGEVIKPGSGEVVKPGSGEVMKPGSGEAVDKGPSEGAKKGSAEAIKLDSGETKKTASTGPKTAVTCAVDKHDISQNREREKSWNVKNCAMEFCTLVMIGAMIFACGFGFAMLINATERREYQDLEIYMAVEPPSTTVPPITTTKAMLTTEKTIPATSTEGVSLSSAVAISMTTNPTADAGDQNATTVFLESSTTAKVAEETTRTSTQTSTSPIGSSSTTT